MSDVALSRGNWLERGIGALGIRGANFNLLLGAAIVIGWALVALLAPWIAPYDPIAHNLPEKLQPPGVLHPFGTDNFGRDILSRVIHGARIDLHAGAGHVVATGERTVTQALTSVNRTTPGP